MLVRLGDFSFAGARDAFLDAGGTLDSSSRQLYAEAVTAYRRFSALDSATVDVTLRMIRSLQRLEDLETALQLATRSLAPTRGHGGVRTDQLPWFVRSLELFEAHREYGDQEPSIDVNTLIRNARTFIEIQRAIIERGA